MCYYLETFSICCDEIFTPDLYRKIALFFTPVWLVWHWYNFYVQRFEESTIRHRAMTFLLMWCIGVYSYSIHDVWLEVTDLLIYSCVAAHYLLWYLFISASKNPANIEVSRPSMLMGLAHIIFAISRFIGWFFLNPESYITLMWVTIMSFLILLVAIPFVLKKIPSINSEYFGERFGLFIIIVLAELIYGLIEGVSETTVLTNNVIAVTIWWFLIGIAIWRLYFDVIWHNAIKETSLKYVTIRSLLHLPISLAIIYLGGNFLHMIFQVSSNIIQTELMFITWSLVLFIVMLIWILSFFHVFEWKERAVKLNLPESFPGFLIIAQVLVLGWVFRFLQISEPAQLIAVLLVFFVVNIILFHYFFDPVASEETFE